MGWIVLGRMLNPVESRIVLRYSSRESASRRKRDAVLAVNASDRDASIFSTFPKFRDRLRSK
jgi:hypothetical protein